jgi:hypothetical protein
MSITIDPNGRRSVSVTVDVPGSLREVWEAVATGPGISGWFLPCEIQYGFDADPVRLIVHLGPHTTKVADVKQWSPPHVYRAVSEDLMVGAPPLLTQWSVQPLDQGCCVKVEHSLTGDSDEWDSLLLRAADGWPPFLRILNVYLTHFSGKRCEGCSLLISTSDSPDKAWETLAEPLGISGSSIGERCKSHADAPVLAGVLEGEDNQAREALLRLDEPAPGIAHLQIARLHGCTVPTVRLYFYGEQAVAVVSREEPRWQAWLSELFGSQ